MAAATQLIDIGANLTHESFARDLGAVIERADAAGVSRQIVTGSDVSASRAAARLAFEHPGKLWSTVGVHPHHAATHAPAAHGELAELIDLPQVVAVGECGLDYYRDLSPRDAQRRAFVAQLELAVASGKPVFLHERDAHADFAAIVAEFRHGLAGGVAHCFTGGRPELEVYLELGLCIGITGWICDDRRGASVRDAVPHVPAERLMLETDAPYLLPRDLVPRPKSRRNEPANLPHVARTVAALRFETPEALAASTTRNAAAFFRLGDGTATARDS